MGVKWVQKQMDSTYALYWLGSLFRGPVGNRLEHLSEKETLFCDGLNRHIKYGIKIYF